MEDVHFLNYHGSYSFSDVMDMSSREREWLIKRLVRQFDFEAERLGKG